MLQLREECGIWPDIACAGFMYLVFGNSHHGDVAVFPETGRVGVKLMGEGYRKSATMEYWEGADAIRTPQPD